jgi:hypothetical protein
VRSRFGDHASDRGDRMRSAARRDLLERPSSRGSARGRSADRFPSPREGRDAARAAIGHHNAAAEFDRLAREIDEGR